MKDLKEFIIEHWMKVLLILAIFAFALKNALS